MNIFNISELIASLANKRPVFYSEADFQHALAWKIKEQLPDADIRLEVPMSLSPRRQSIDIVVRQDGQVFGIELKYKTARNSISLGAEAFSLQNHGAQDINRFLVIKDIWRIEQFLSNKQIDRGFVVFLTNDSLYWRESNNPDAIDANFKLHQGKVLFGSLSWADRVGVGTLQGNAREILLKGNYTCYWLDYAKLDETSKGTFRFLTFSC
ncbi:MAG: hypothetical protein KF698_09705 [Anaerolineales bacterium]|nr:hypothetical protein [Anaerolineales bacterium]